MRPSENTKYQSQDYVGWGKDQAGNTIGSTGRFGANQIAAPALGHGPLTYPGVGNQMVGPNPYGSVPTLGGGQSGGGIWQNILSGIRGIIPGLASGGIAKAGNMYRVNELGQERIKPVGSKGKGKKIPKKVTTIKPTKDMAVIPNPNSVPNAPALPVQGQDTNWTQTPGLPIQDAGASGPLNTMPSLIPGKAGPAVPYDNPITAINNRNAPTGPLTPEQMGPAPKLWNGDINARPTEVYDTPPLTGREKAQADVDSAMAAPVHKQGKLAQGAWMGLQGIQKFIEGYQGKFSGEPVQWLGQAKKDYKVDQANRQLAPYLQQDQIKAGQATAAANTQYATSRAEGQNLQNSQTRLETIMAGRGDQTFTQQDADELARYNIRVKAGDSWSKKRLVDRNGVPYVVDDQQRNLGRAAIDADVGNTLVTTENGDISTVDKVSTYNMGLNKQNNQQQFIERQNILKGKIQAVNKRIADERKATSDAAKSGKADEKVAPKLIGAYTELELAAAEAQKWYNEAEKIAKQYEGKSFEFELNGRKAYNDAIDKAEKAMQRADKVKPKIAELKAK